MGEAIAVAVAVGMWGEGEREREREGSSKHSLEQHHLMLSRTHIAAGKSVRDYDEEGLQRCRGRAFAISVLACCVRSSKKECILVVCY